MKVFRANEMDIANLCLMMHEYAKEARQGEKRKIVSKKVLEYVKKYLFHPDGRAYVAYMKDGGEPCGMLFGSVQEFVFKEKDASIDIHFIMPKYRGSDASRCLVEVAMREFYSDGIGDVYTASESGMGDINNKLYENLYFKFGFEYAGGRNLICFKENNKWD
jgi:hypothetical protein